MTFLLRASAAGAGAFQDLNFDAVTLPSLPPNVGEWVSVQEALPGWSVFYGARQVDTVAHNGLSIGGVMLSVNGPESTADRIEGNYSVAFWPLGDGTILQIVDVSLSQTGDVPSWANSLRFKVAEAGPFGVLANGTPLSLTPIGAGVGIGENYTLYAADISPWSGTSVNLTFTAFKDPYPNFLILDSIQFSTAMIPEPSTLALFGLGILGFSLLWRKGAAACLLLPGAPKPSNTTSPDGAPEAQWDRI